MFINQNVDKIEHIFSNPIIIDHRPEFLPEADKASTPIINNIKKIKGRYPIHITVIICGMFLDIKI